MMMILICTADRENNENFALPPPGEIPRSQVHGHNIFNKEWDDGGLSPQDEASSLTHDKDLTQY